MHDLLLMKMYVRSRGGYFFGFCLEFNCYFVTFGLLQVLKNNILPAGFDGNQGTRFSLVFIILLLVLLYPNYKQIVILVCLFFCSILPN